MSTVSVIVTAFNAESYLEAALRSIAAQSRLPQEVIVVDDGSDSDAAAQIVGNLQARYPTPIEYIYQVNRGPSSARNLGLQRSGGDYVAFLDADDLFTPDKLSLQVPLLDSLADDYACVLGSAEQFYDHRRRRRIVAPTPVDGFPDIDAFLSGELRLEGTPAYLFRRDTLIGTGGYDESLSNNEDFELLLRLTRQYKLKTHEDVVFHQRMRDDSLSRSNPTRALVNSLKFIKLAEDHYSPDPLAVARGRQRAFFNAARSFLTNIELAEFVWAVQRGCDASPSHESRKAAIARLIARLLPVSAREPDDFRLPN